MRLAAYTLAGLVAVLALCCGAGTLLARRLEPVPRAEAPTDPETSFLETRSGRVHILDQGAGDVVLLVNGTGRSLADWQEGLAERLAQRHRVVAYDYYGKGLSDRAHPLRYGIALWARQGIDVLDALDIERVTVVGHSAGGGVAAILAADHPERIERAVFIGHGMAMDPAQFVPIIPGLGELALGRTAIFGRTWSDRHRERLEVAYRIRGTRAALLTYIRRQYTIDGVRLAFGTYEDIEQPILQLHGEHDEAIPVPAARALSGRLLETRFVVVEGAPHDVHIDSPDRVAEEIEAFIEETGG